MGRNAYSKRSRQPAGNAQRCNDPSNPPTQPAMILAITQPDNQHIDIEFTEPLVIDDPTGSGRIYFIARKGADPSTLIETAVPFVQLSETTLRFAMFDGIGGPIEPHDFYSISNANNMPFQPNFAWIRAGGKWIWPIDTFRLMTEI